eukprot:TRINITY_DN346_c0_g2_i1.p1 TRINITY_DN346_c0_g2~~TRINITY_DN346_c0_g2_i1.p1  ORF type:complete len:658 (+),score=92.60 TRINITY_DN346_c0_g2_i1:391-2364(+)
MAPPEKFLGVLALMVLIVAASCVDMKNAEKLSKVDGRIPLSSAKPAWATTETFVEDASPDHVLHFTVYLEWRDPVALEALALRVSDPADSMYRQFLSPTEFHARFGPTEETVKALEKWVMDQGFTVVHIPLSRKHVVVEGTVAQAMVAFNTKFALYEMDGKKLRAPSSVPSVPFALSSVVGRLTVVGLDQGFILKKKHTLKRELEKMERSVAAASSLCYWTAASTADGAATYPSCGYSAAQFREAYGVPDELTGHGQSIAIVDAYATPFMENDLKIWSESRGIPSGKLVQVYPDYTYTLPEILRDNASPGYVPGWAPEEVLDIEIVHGMAPNATIVYMGAASSAWVDMTAAISAVLDYGLASIISNSYGATIPPKKFQEPKLTIAQFKPVSDVLLQAAAQGVAVMFSSGDYGDNTMTGVYGPIPSTDYPATDPWATAVGGTTLGIDSTGKRVLETYWGDALKDGNSEEFLYGGGGGISDVYLAPGYQTNTSLASAAFLAEYATSGYGRVVPDVSADGSPFTGFYVGYSTISSATGTGYYSDYTFLQPVFANAVYGGTSLASPMFAAIVALTQEKVNATLGFLNPLLYSLPANAFYDIVNKTGTLSVESYTILYGQLKSLKSVKGFDSATGFGVPSATFYENVMEYIANTSSSIVSTA